MYVTDEHNIICTGCHLKYEKLYLSYRIKSITVKSMEILVCGPRFTGRWRRIVLHNTYGGGGGD